jgi:hypothetical protein
MFRGLFPFTGEIRTPQHVLIAKGGKIMTKKFFAPLLLALAVTACDSSVPETNSNANNPTKANTNGQVSTTPAPSPSSELKPQLKAGDKVKVATNGSFTDATVVNVDEKLGKVTVKLQGQSEEKTVAIGDVIKQ